MKPIATSLTLALVLLAASTGLGQIRVQGGNVTLAITTGIPGPVPPSVSSSTTTLRWSQERVTTKVTIATRCPGQKFTLRVLATGVSGGGTPAPEATLQDGMLATDFVLDIPPRRPNNGSCTVRYTAVAPFEQGNSTELGDDVHTVTYTLVAQ